MKQLCKYLIIFSLLFVGCKEKDIVNPENPMGQGTTCCEEAGGKDSLFFAIQNTADEAKTFRLFGGGTNLPSVDDNETLNSEVSLQSNISVDGNPFNYLIDGGLAYISCEFVSPGVAFIPVIDLTTGLLYKNIPITSTPSMLAKTGNKIYKDADASNIAVIDVLTDAESIVSIAPFTAPSYFFAYEDYIYIAAQRSSDNTLHLLKLDPSSNLVVDNLELGSYDPGISGADGIVSRVDLNGITYLVAGSLDGFIYAVNISNGSLSLSYSVALSSGNPSGSISVGNYIYVIVAGDNSINVLNTLTGVISDNIAVSSSPIGIIYDSGFVYCTSFGDELIEKIDVSDNSIVATIPVSGGPIGVTRINNYLYISRNTAGAVSYLDVNTDQVQGSISTGAGASTIFVSGSRTYVLNNDAESITVLSTESAPEVNVDVNGDMTITEINADTLANPICICKLRLDGTSEAMYNTLLYKKRKDSNGLIETETVDMREYLPAAQNSNNNLVDIPGDRFKSCVLDGFNYLEWEVPAGETVNVTISYCRSTRSQRLGFEQPDMKWDDMPSKPVKRKFVHGSFKYILK
jgi:hypothetical protein